MAGKSYSLVNCGRFGLLTYRQIAQHAGISVAAAYHRKSRGVTGEALCARLDRLQCRRAAKPSYRHGQAIDPSASGALFMAIRVAKAFPHAPPTADQLMKHFGMQRATAYRWRRAWLDAAGVHA